MEIEKWSKGRPLFLTTIAITYAAAAEGHFKLLEAIKNGDLKKTNFVQPPVSEWLSLYRQHRRVWKFFYESFSFVLPSAFSLVEMAEEMSEEQNRPDDLYKEFEEFLVEHRPILEAFHLDNLKIIREEIEVRKGGPDGGQGLIPDPDMSSPEILFIYKVWIPCYFLYGATPGKLLRAGRQGDLEALDQLLRLDKSAIFDSKISEMVHRFSYRSQSKYDVVLGALRKVPARKITRQRFKAFIAAYIAFFFELFGHKLIEPEIRALFDAVAKDYGRGDIDTDLPEGPESFSKAIRRELPYWKASFR